MGDITGILLASGASSRFGDHKLLATINQQPLIAYSVAALAACDRIIAVVRKQDDALKSVLQELAVDCVVNDEPARGMGHSIALGVRATADSQAWCLLPADMPCVKNTSVQQLVDALWAGSELVVLFHNNQRGHPVGFGARFYQELAGLDGDQGARRLLQEYSALQTHIRTDDPGILYDVDEPDDLKAMWPGSL